MKEEFEGVIDTAGDLKVSLSKPNSEEQPKLYISRKGTVKRLILEDNIPEAVNLLADFSDKIPENITFICKSCGNHIKAESEPYKCNCGSKSFKLGNGSEDKADMVNNLKVYFYFQKNPQLEICVGDRTLIFEDIVGSGGKMKEVFTEIREALN